MAITSPDDAALSAAPIVVYGLLVQTLSIAARGFAPRLLAPTGRANQLDGATVNVAPEAVTQAAAARTTVKQKSNTCFFVVILFYLS